MKSLQFKIPSRVVMICITATCMVLSAVGPAAADEVPSKLASAYEKMRNANRKHLGSQRRGTNSFARTRVDDQKYVDALIAQYMGKDAVSIQRGFKSRPVQLPPVGLKTENAPGQTGLKIARKMTITPEMHSVSTKLPKASKPTSRSADKPRPTRMPIVVAP